MPLQFLSNLQGCRCQTGTLTHGWNWAQGDKGTGPLRQSSRRPCSGSPIWVPASLQVASESMHLAQLSWAVQDWSTPLRKFLRPFTLAGSGLAGTFLSWQLLFPGPPPLEETQPLAESLSQAS